MGFDGFDSVELVIAVEDCFKISIPDTDAERIQTVGQFADYVAGRVGAVDDQGNVRCLTATAFYRARRKLMSAAWVERSDIRPDTPIELFLNPAHRRAAWKRLGEVLGVKLPGLRHSGLEALASGLFFLLLVCGLIAMKFAESWATAFLLLAGSIAAPSIIIYLARTRFATEVPRFVSTVGAVSSLTVGNLIEKRRQRGEQPSRHDVYEIVRYFTATSAGVPPTMIKRDTNFIRDLNVI
jgi:hypothetical protein